MTVAVHHGDSREVLKTLADASIDSCVTDPPYALISTLKRFANSPRTESSMPTAGPYARASAGFMGQKWDTGQTTHDPAFWREVNRVLKPGAHVVAFAGTRTYHRLACAVEDAGFEIRDMVAWLYGSGFPKSHNQKGEWEGWGTALKPALEPIVLARKPLIGTVSANVLKHGTGALNIDGCRVEGVKPQVTQGVNGNATSFNVTRERRLSGDPMEGRWPANVAHDGSEEVVSAFPDAPGQQRGSTDAERSRLNVYGEPSDNGKSYEPRGDSGSAARFFYTTKAGAEDRLGSKHPTVKPVDLMRWLVRLVTPPGGVVLDPFAGTGTTGLAAMAEGFDCIQIEREAEYVADIERRMAWARGEGLLTAQEANRRTTDDYDDLELFGRIA